MATKSSEAIVAAARAKKDRLVLIMNRIEDEKEDIREKQFVAPLSAGDLKALDELSADQDVIRRALKDLGLVTVQALDRADEVQFILNAIATARRRLKSAENRLAKFAKRTGDFAVLLDKLNKLGERLKKHLERYTEEVE